MPGLVVRAVSTKTGTDILLQTTGPHPAKRSYHIRESGVRQILISRLSSKLYVAVLAPLNPRTLHLYEIRNSGLKKTWSGIPSTLKPWKIQIGDIDGDGITEIGVGVRKKSRFHPVFANRPFIYSWENGKLYQKWLGSRLGRPFTDFVFASFPSGSMLLAVEVTSDGANELAVYKWDRFGFEWKWSGAHFRRISDLHVCGPEGRQTIRISVDHQQREYVWDGKQLITREAK